MNSAFPGFSREAMQFFRGLARNNNREWFQPRKPVFEQHVKQPMHELVAQVNTALRGFAPEYVTEPSKAVYRFYRDTRFSADKTPYKDHIAASFHHRALTGQAAAGYYFHVSHKEVGIGGGVYMTTPETLRAIRTYLADRPSEFRKIISAAPVKKLFGGMQGEQLTRIPKGFACDHPAADLIRYKQFLMWSELPAEVATTKDLYSEIVKRFRAMTPFLAFLNAPLKAQKKKAIDPLEIFR